MAIKTDQLSTAGRRTTLRITAAWQLTNERLKIRLRSPDQSTFARWLAGDKVTPDPELYARISYVLEIYTALHTLYTHVVDADGRLWQHDNYPPFGNTQAIHLVLSGLVRYLQLVREHLHDALEW